MCAGRVGLDCQTRLSRRKWLYLLAFLQSFNSLLCILNRLYSTSTSYMVLQQTTRYSNRLLGSEMWFPNLYTVPNAYASFFAPRLVSSSKLRWTLPSGSICINSGWWRCRVMEKSCCGHDGQLTLAKPIALWSTRSYLWRMWHRFTATLSATLTDPTIHTLDKRKLALAKNTTSLILRWIVDSISADNWLLILFLVSLWFENHELRDRVRRWDSRATVKTPYRHRNAYWYQQIPRLDLKSLKQRTDDDVASCVSTAELKAPRLSSTHSTSISGQFFYL